jgi:hypothetical protein
VVEHSPHGGAAILIGVDLVGEFGRVGTQEIVERVSAGGVLYDQVRPGELLQ